jgi:8-oxo-dGTP pyrophosphatase MutT (NUDIX family)
MLLLDRPSRGEVRLPKGHIEEDEDAETAAVREVAEESGYADLTVLADLGVAVVEFEYAGEHYVRQEHYFLAELGSDFQTERGKKDAEQFRVLWSPVGEACERLTYAAEQEVAAKALVVHAERMKDH